MKDLNTPLLDIVNRKLVETNIDCANPYQQVHTQSTSTTTIAATELPSTITGSETISATEATAHTTGMAMTKPNGATTVNASEGAQNTTSSSTVLPSEQQQAMIFPERKPIKHHDKKLDKPYRPPKEVHEL